MRRGHAVNGQPVTVYTGGKQRRRHFAAQDLLNIRAVIRQQDIALQRLLHGAVINRFIDADRLFLQIQLHSMTLTFRLLPPIYVHLFLNMRAQSLLALTNC